MAKSVDGLKMQFDVASAVLSGARDVVRADGHEPRQSLELAAGQMAIGMSTSPDNASGVVLIEDAIERYRQKASPERKDDESNFFTIEDVLSEEARVFLPAARVIVGLTYQAARLNTATRLQER
jgi:hypothetical protein